MFCPEEPTENGGGLNFTGELANKGSRPVLLCLLHMSLLPGFVDLVKAFNQVLQSHQGQGVPMGDK